MQENQSTPNTYRRQRRTERHAALYEAEARQEAAKADGQQPEPAGAGESHGAFWQEQPRQSAASAARRGQKRPWQKEQPADWTDRIRVVRYDDDEQPEEPEVHRACEQLAVDRVVRLAATIASMVSLFALFLLVEERQSRALRHYSLQSVALSAIHLVIGAAAALILWLTAAIPVLGFVIRLACLLLYCGGAIALLVLRVRLMAFAWGGYRWDVPVIGEWLQRFMK